MCPTCSRPSNRCYCMTCYSFRADGTIASHHKFNPNSGRAEDALCHECYCCTEHCQATACPDCASKSHSICTNCHKCSRCCPCLWCNYWGASHVVESRCEVCAYCEDHCNCPRCKTCNAKGKCLCRHCHSCQTCCLHAPTAECGGFGLDTPIPYMDSGLTKHIPTRKELTKLPLARLIGVEVEVNNSRNLAKGKKLRDALYKWGDSVVSDGSIGGQPRAFEINCMPSGGDKFIDHIRELTDGLAMFGASPDSSCGLHVHIDASDLEVYDLNRVIQLYAKVERALFDLCHPSRLNNHYSVPCRKFYLEGGLTHKPAEFRQRLVSRLYFNDQPILTPESIKQKAASYWGSDYTRGDAKRRKELEKIHINQVVVALKKEKQHKYRNVRYKALNLHSYWLRKTIEFRHHEGTVDFDAITGWAMVCQHLIDITTKLSPAHIEALPRNSRKALIGVMPERLHDFITTTWKKNDELVARDRGYQESRSSEWGATACAA